MRVSRWILTAALGGLLTSGGAVARGSEGIIGNGAAASTGRAGSELAQLPQVAPAARPAAPAAKPPREAQAKPAAPGAAAPTTTQGPRRTETTEYDSWVVTCSDTTVSGAPKRSCIAALRVANQNRRLMLNWEIGLNPEGRWMTAIHVPSGLTLRQGDKTVASPPILIADGVELKFGNGVARRLNYVSCGPRQCLAEAAVDDAFVKEALANANGKASITVHTAGGVAPFDLPIKGIDKAIASTRK